MGADAGTIAAGGFIGRMAGFSAAAGGMAGVAMVIHKQLENLVDWASKKMGAEFWDRVYGSEPGTVRRIKEAHEDIVRTVKQARSLESKDAADLKNRVFENQTDQGKLESLKVQLAEAQKASAAAEAEMNFRKQNAKEAKGHLGADLTVGQKMALFAEYATAKADWHKQRMAARDLEDKLKKLLWELTARGVQETSAATTKKDPEMRHEITKATFEADSLARVGLFAGSALLMNPDFSQSAEQTYLLRVIADNTGRTGSIL